ncbi:MAG: cytochrome d ubiquinol oxidase subunit II [Deltaproteobacteria bacterium]|nr:cytochrome d ubiquinol oxidase subunit II [Deltaproteobacteria bacterium]
MTLADLIALVMLAALIIYMLSGGADFGGGVWDLFASGPRRERQRQLIESAIAPVWEANHVWLILVIVLLFTAFPRAFAVILTGLHVPLTLMLLGILARGSAFVFRQYGGYDPRGRARWGRVFAIASLVTPVFLGASLATLCTGRLALDGGRPLPGTLSAWLAPLPLATGAFTLALCAFLAAVYLIHEADDDALRDDFRLRALASGLLVGATALVAALASWHSAAPFAHALFHAPWSLPLQLATGASATAALAGLATRRYGLARACAIAQTTLILTGFGLAQHPYLVRPGLTFADAAAPVATLRLLAPTLAAGAVILFPSLYYMLRVFKPRRDAPAATPPAGAATPDGPPRPPAAR